jgi:hypothetical protein
MKKIFLAFIFSISIVVLLLSVLLVYPYHYYNDAIKNKAEGRWFHLSRFDERFYTPGKMESLESVEMKNNDLWSKFHFQNIKIPLPKKNPFYRVSPDLHLNGTKTTFGLSLFNTNKERISRILFVSPYVMKKNLRAQELFKLPIVREVLVGIKEPKLWRLLFEKEIKGWNISFSEMATNLYLLHLRSEILPKNFLTYKLINYKTAVVELESKQKDFSTELVMTRARGLIYSFILITEKDNEESKLLRYKFLKEIEFIPSSPVLTDILYKEFKALDYKDQVDNLGMLYLLSAWSHKNDKDLLKEMIFFLERGVANQKELQAIYPYVYKTFGKTFSTQKVDNLDLTNDLFLKLQVEQEFYQTNLKEVEESQKKDDLLIRKPLPIKKENIKLIKKENRIYMN